MAFQKGGRKAAGLGKADQPSGALPALDPDALSPLRHGGHGTNEGDSATVDAIMAAVEASSHLTVLDAPTVQAALALAYKIDSEVDMRAYCLQWSDEHDARPPSPDNVSLPTLLKYLDALRLTPGSRGTEVGGAAAAPAAKKGGGVGALI